MLNIIDNDDTKSEVKIKINNNLSNFDNIVSQTFINNNYQETFKINYGLNYFPEKKFKGETIKAGNYESLVIKIGEGKGDNWWCFLFPPLCLLEAEESEEKVEYNFFIKKIINKIFK